MRFDVITLFPELFEPHCKHGVTRRAFESRQVDVRLWPLRDFAGNTYRRVDDRPFGGGPGMVMMVEPLARAVSAIRADRGDAGDGVVRADAADAADGTNGARTSEPDVGPPPVSAAPASSPETPVVMFTPTGRRLDQEGVRRHATGQGAILICGRYEGVDQRFIDQYVDIEISIGDFVLSGGELAALVLLDAVARLQEGVLNDAGSHQQDSFSDGLLDCPHYSRPEVLQTPQGEAGIPAVLKSGNHAEIARWRREQSLALTADRRPDLLDAARAAGRLSQSDEQYLRRRRL